MAKRCNTPILWNSSLLLVQSRPDAFKAIIRAQISQNVKYWYKICDVLVPIFHAL